MARPAAATRNRRSRGKRESTPRNLSYWSDARTPLHSLLFLMPMTIFYEVGIVWVQGDHVVRVRNGGDVMLRRLLALFGRPGVAASALVLVVVLLAWQLISRRPWRVRPRVLALMLLESAALAGFLYLFALVYRGRVPGAMRWESPLEVAAPAGQPGPVVPPVPHFPDRVPPVLQLVLSFGNGIYEELVFRLLLVSALMVLFHKGLGLDRNRAVWWAVGLSALAFAVAHYVGPMGDVFAWRSFIFRFSAGVFFSAVLAFRGFGIAAGSHALYDVAVVLAHTV